MSDYVGKYKAYRNPLIWTALLFSVIGCGAALFNNWYLSSLCWTLAFACKFAQCWLLERAIVEEADAKTIASPVVGRTVNGVVYFETVENPNA